MNWPNPQKRFILTTPIALSFASLAGRPAALIRMTSELNLGSLNRPILLFGGLYSNAQTTEALLNQAIALHIAPTNIICTRDVVAYTGDRAQTTNLIMPFV